MSNLNKRPATEDFIEKIFSLVPIIYNNQGITIANLLKKTSYKNRKDLEDAIDRLIMFGAPPFSPSDFISIHIDSQQKVWLDFPMGLERPLALTSNEWSLLQKIFEQEIIFVSKSNSNTEYLTETLATLGEVPIKIENDELINTHRNLIQEAMQDSLQITFLYKSLSSNEAEIRRVDPLYLFKNYSSNYLLAFCHTRNNIRLFLLEKMQSLEILDLKQTLNNTEDIVKILIKSNLFSNNLNKKGFTVSIAFDPQIQFNLEKILFLSDKQSYENKKLNIKNWLTAKTKIMDSNWFKKILLGFGTEIILLEPKHLRTTFYKELTDYKKGFLKI